MAVRRPIGVFDVPGESVKAFFVGAVKPRVPDARIDADRRDPTGGKVGLVGYALSEQDIVRMLGEAAD